MIVGDGAASGKLKFMTTYFDTLLISRIVQYIKFGHDPGCTGTAMLLGDYDTVSRYYSYSPSLTFNFLQDIIPEIVTGSRKLINDWMAHEGLLKAPDTVKVQLVLNDDWDISNWESSKVRDVFGRIKVLPVPSSGYVRYEKYIYEV